MVHNLNKRLFPKITVTRTSPQKDDTSPQSTEHSTKRHSRSVFKEDAESGAQYLSPKVKATSGKKKPARRSPPIPKSMFRSQEKNQTPDLRSDARKQPEANKVGVDSHGARGGRLGRDSGGISKSNVVHFEHDFGADLERRSNFFESQILMEQSLARFGENRPRNSTRVLAENLPRDNLARELVESELISQSQLEKNVLLSRFIKQSEHINFDKLINSGQSAKKNLSHASFALKAPNYGKFN